MPEQKQENSPNPEIKSDPPSTNNTPENVSYKRNDPRVLGTHPDSFYTHDIERDFSPTENSNLDEPRWLKNEFFETRGPSITVRLDDLHHGPDTSDRQLAADILMRAGLSDHPRRKELMDKFARALGEIEDPELWLNPVKEQLRKQNADNSSKRARTSS